MSIFNLKRFWDWRNKTESKHNDQVVVEQEQKCEIITNTCFASNARAETSPLNCLTLEQLKSVSGIGEKLATKIIESRPYNNVEDLIKIKGVSKRIVENIRELVKD